jgi:hypothetical protein
MLQQAAKITFIFTNNKKYFVLNASIKKPLPLRGSNFAILCPYFIKNQTVI